MPDLVEFNVGGKLFTTTFETISFDKKSTLYVWYIERKGSAYLNKDKSGAYFIDRDPYSFSIILNYLRLQTSKQLWEACLPKDPDRLALLTQEAEYFRLPLLRDQAIALLHTCTEKSDPYVNEENQLIYPKLAERAHRFLSAPATSQPSEQIFSVARDVYDYIKLRC